VRNDAWRIDRPTGGATAINHLAADARSYKMAESVAFTLVFIAIAQATILMIFRVYDISQSEAGGNDPSALEFTGSPDAEKFHARPLAPGRQDGGVIHSRHPLGSMTRKTLDWYLQGGAASGLHAHFNPEDN
jgi:hypothetical protein